jgi:hypothetical protein
MSGCPLLPKPGQRKSRAVRTRLPRRAFGCLNCRGGDLVERLRFFDLVPVDEPVDSDTRVAVSPRGRCDLNLPRELVCGESPDSLRSGEAASELVDLRQPARARCRIRRFGHRGRRANRRLAAP